MKLDDDLAHRGAFDERAGDLATAILDARDDLRVLEAMQASAHLGTFHEHSVHLPASTIAAIDPQRGRIPGQERLGHHEDVAKIEREMRADMDAEARRSMRRRASWRWGQKAAGRTLAHVLRPSMRRAS